MSRIKVTIDQLALKGFAPADRKAIVQGLETELSRILADPAKRSEWGRSHRTPALQLGRMPFEAGPSGSRKFGGGLARAIGKALTP